MVWWLVVEINAFTITTKEVFFLPNDQTAVAGSVLAYTSWSRSVEYNYIYSDIDEFASE